MHEIRMYHFNATARVCHRILALRRKRVKALSAMRRALALRPDWVPTDARLAAAASINGALHSFKDPLPSQQALQDAKTIAATLRKHRFSASEVQRRFKIGGARTAGGRPISRSCLQALGTHNVEAGFDLVVSDEGNWHTMAGPFYIGRQMDHRARPTAPAPPKDGTDALIQLFLLGVSLPISVVHQLLGPEILQAAARLGLVGRWGTSGAEQVKVHGAAGDGSGTGEMGRVVPLGMGSDPKGPSADASSWSDADFVCPVSH